VTQNADEPARHRVTRRMHVAPDVDMPIGRLGGVVDAVSEGSPRFDVSELKQPRVKTGDLLFQLRFARFRIFRSDVMRSGRLDHGAD